MACVDEFTVDDGTTQVLVQSGSTADAYQISRELLEEGVDRFRAANGAGTLYVRFQTVRYTISGTGPADPGLWRLELKASPWTVTIPGFADGSANEIWSVLPARPSHNRDRRGGVHSWSITFDTAAAV